jgi:cytochrome c oxidase subunit 2
MSAPASDVRRPHGLFFQGRLPKAAAALAACALSAAAVANTSNGYNLPIGVTEMSRDIYGLHMEAFWICVGIAIVVFGAMIYSLVKFRASQGAVADTTMLHSTKVEIAWTIVPVVILVVMAIPAAELILKMEDMRNSDLSIRVTGYQWKWEYQYMDAGAGIDFFSTLKQDSNFARQLRSGIDPNSVPNYLLDVDHPLVVPSGTKVRVILTSGDVIHAWYVPDFGLKRSAVPGFINEASIAANARRSAAAIMASCPWWSTSEHPTISRSGSRSRRRRSSRRPPRRPMRRASPRRAAPRRAALRPARPKH